jgi:hypothetical protein
MDQLGVKQNDRETDHLLSPHDPRDFVGQEDHAAPPCRIHKG